jgi:hypothetical protein
MCLLPDDISGLYISGFSVYYNMSRNAGKLPTASIIFL